MIDEEKMDKILKVTNATPNEKRHTIFEDGIHKRNF